MSTLPNVIRAGKTTAKKPRPALDPRHAVLSAGELNAMLRVASQQYDKWRMDATNKALQSGRPDSLSREGIQYYENLIHQICDELQRRGFLPS